MHADVMVVRSKRNGSYTLKLKPGYNNIEIHIKLIPKLITDTSFNLFIHIRCVDLHGGGGQQTRYV
jgi:hypothetical protein